MKWDTKKFIQECKNRFGDKFDYSETVYKGMGVDIRIYCREHGVWFSRRASRHKDGSGCDRCMGLVRTLEDFVWKSKITHGDKYDYSESVYVDAKVPIRIYCKEHKVFFTQCSYDHHSGKKTPSCCNEEHKQAFFDSLRTTKKEFLQRAILIFGNIYDYSCTIFPDKHNNKSIVNIKCKKHNKIFPKAIGKHLGGQGCPICSKELQGENQKYTTEQFIEKAIKVHGNLYGYDKVEYIDSRTDVLIYCKACKKYFLQAPANHLGGSICFDCSHILRGAKKALSKEVFIKRSILVQGDKYDYSKVEYKNVDIEVLIFCKVHKKYFKQTPYSHMKGSTGCVECYKEKVSGENHPLYKDGKSIERARERNCPEYREWAQDVKQDKTYCECCGESFFEWNTAHAHHLNSWIDHPDERFDVDNGVAICESCHVGFHTLYGWGFNNKDQYYQFKQEKEVMCG